MICLICVCVLYFCSVVYAWFLLAAGEILPLCWPSISSSSRPGPSSEKLATNSDGPLSIQLQEGVSTAELFPGPSARVLPTPTVSYITHSPFNLPLPSDKPLARGTTLQGA